MSSTPDLSIVIVNWNSAAFVRKCLMSIYASTRDLQCEVVVVDNGSFDGCGEIVRGEFPKAKFIQRTKNAGFAKANNLGFEHSAGRNVLFLNPDTEILGSSLQTMLSFIESMSDAGIVGARLLNSDLSVQADCIQSFPSILNQALDIGYLRTLVPKSPMWDTQPLFKNEGQAVPVDAISGACMMLRRGVFEQVGGFSTDYFMYGEDVDLCYKVKRAGWKTYHLGNANVLHHGGRSVQVKRESAFTAIMMRESLLTFMRVRRGRLYAAAYQSSIVLVAVLRLFLLGLILVLTLGRFRREFLYLALEKWARVFRWAIGLEGWVREFT